MSEAINNDRRRFFGTAIMTLAAARFGATRFSNMSISTMTPEAGIAVAARTGSSFDSLKQIDAGVLNVGYAEAGPASGRPVILLHGWPYDIHAFEEVAPILAAKGYRVIMPYLRGYGTTRFLSDATMRNGEKARRSVAAQIGDDDSVSLRCQDGRDLFKGVDVVRPAVKQNHRRAIRWPRLGVSDIQNAGVNLFQRVKRGAAGRRTQVSFSCQHLV